NNDNGVRIGLEDSLNQAILAAILGEIHIDTIVTLGFPLGIQANNNNSDISFHGSIDGLLNMVHSILLLVSDTYTS
ncbi:hypothetical protein OR221_2664, partial [Microbacterium laevaniformans OR221]